MKLEASELCWTWHVVHDVLCRGAAKLAVRPPFDYRLVFSKVRDEVVLLLAEGSRWGEKKRGLLFDATVQALERQGYVLRTALGEGPDAVIDFTDSGEEKMLADEWPEFEDTKV